MSARRVFIFGAGEMQRPAIQAARAAGFHTVVADGNRGAPCVPLADTFFPIDLKDTDALLSCARQLHADGALSAVFTAGTDFSAAVSYVAEALGLPAHPYEAALNASIKTRMRACFERAGIPSPAFEQITVDVPVAEVMHRVARIGFPCVVKPVDNMGARGCRMVRSESELSAAIVRARSNSRSGTVIVEQYLDGPEYSIDALIVDGTFTVTGCADRHIFFPPYFIEMGHTMPAVCGELERNELIATCALAARALGLTCGAAKADIKYTARGPMVGEIAARLSGGYMSGWTFPYAADCAVTAEALKIACGDTPDGLLSRRIPVSYTPPGSCAHFSQPYDLYEVPCVRTSAERAYISIPGTVHCITGADSAVAVPYVRDFLPRVHAGDAVVFPRNNVEKCGNVIAVAPQRSDVIIAAERAAAAVTVRLVPHTAATDEFLAGGSAPDEPDFPPSAFPLAECAADLTAIIARCAGVIAQDSPVAAVVPDVLKLRAAGTMRDFNGLTFLETLSRFDALCPKHPALDAEQFWCAVIRGGIQGALYVADSARCRAP
ncbi:MAG: ATP-grasp domain-containing protein [Treponema sp.]|nr:ATP-grasp domain-containing protein [Treponema sp.]